MTLSKRYPLKYFFSETHYFERDYSILIVTLVGELKNENLKIFHQCIDQISRSTAKWVIINFRDVSKTSDESLIPSIKSLIDAVHVNRAGVRISGVHPDIRKLIQAEGFVAESEFSNNFSEALESLPTTEL